MSTVWKMDFRYTKDEHKSLRLREKYGKDSRFVWNNEGFTFWGTAEELVEVVESVGLHVKLQEYD